MEKESGLRKRVLARFTPICHMAIFSLEGIVTYFSHHELKFGRASPNTFARSAVDRDTTPSDTERANSV